MKVGILLITLGFGMLGLPALLGGIHPAPGALAPEILPPPANVRISESMSRTKCEAAIAEALPEGITPDFTPLDTGWRPLDGYGKSLKVVFSAKNSRSIRLEFAGWCEVALDGTTHLVSLTESAGKDFLASSQPPNIRNEYLQKVKVGKPQIEAQRAFATVSNRNDFAIKSTEIVCRVIFSDPPRTNDKTIIIGRVILAGTWTSFLIPRANGATSVACRVTDFLKGSSEEQRLIDAFGPAAGQSSYSRLRQDAARLGVHIENLVEPYIALAKSPPSYLH